MPLKVVHRHPGGIAGVGVRIVSGIAFAVGIVDGQAEFPAPIEPAVAAGPAAGNKKGAAEERNGAGERGDEIPLGERIQGIDVIKERLVIAEVIAGIGADRPAEPFRPLFGDDIDDAGLRLPVFRVEGPGDNLEFLNAAVVHLDGLAAVKAVGHGHAVDQVGHLGGSAAAHVDLSPGIDGDPRLQLQQARHLFGGELGDAGFGERGGGKGHIFLDQRFGGDDGDALAGDHGLPEGKIDDSGIVRRNGNLLDDLALMADHAAGEAVAARRQVKKEIAPFSVADGAAAGALDEDLGADQRGMGGGIPHLPGDLAGGAGGAGLDQKREQKCNGQVKAQIPSGSYFIHIPPSPVPQRAHGFLSPDLVPRWFPMTTPSAQLLYYAN